MTAINGASPQVQNGYSPIANELLDAMLRARFNGYQWAWVMWVVRNCYGWSRKSAAFTIAGVARSMGMDRRGMARALWGLVEAKILIVSGSQITIQKDYTMWGGLESHGTGVPGTGVPWDRNPMGQESQGGGTGVPFSRDRNPGASYAREKQESKNSKEEELVTAPLPPSEQLPGPGDRSWLEDPAPKTEKSAGVSEAPAPTPVRPPPPGPSKAAVPPARTPTPAGLMTPPESWVPPKPPWRPDPKGRPHRGGVPAHDLLPDTPYIWHPSQAGDWWEQPWIPLPAGASVWARGCEDIYRAAGADPRDRSGPGRFALAFSAMRRTGQELQRAWGVQGDQKAVEGELGAWVWDRLLPAARLSACVRKTPEHERPASLTWALARLCAAVELAASDPFWKPKTKTRAGIEKAWPTLLRQAQEGDWPAREAELARQFDPEGR